MKNLYLLIGNGSSIGIVNQINDYRVRTGQAPLMIDLSNLFYYGASFNFPMTNEPFLTEANCPYLWSLGARPLMNSAQANQIISQIITCGNVYALAKYQEQILSTNNFARSTNRSIDLNLENAISHNTKYANCNYCNCKPVNWPCGSEVINELFFKAYGEFSSYIRYLIIFYNNQITDDDLSNIDVPLIDYITTNYNNFDQIIVNCYNYDVVFERLLFVNHIPFQLGCFDTPYNNPLSKIIVYKPHGSISFFYKKSFLPGTTYQIPYNELSFQQTLTLQDFDIQYDFTEEYPKHNGMIPPYGEAERYEITYYQKIRNALILQARKSRPEDIYFIIGSAYGTFDRFELDRINTNYNKLLSVTYVNPFPNKDYEAVLSSLFINYSQSGTVPIS